jgi:hypothetical protein
MFLASLLCGRLRGIAFRPVGYVLTRFAFAAAWRVPVGVVTFARFVRGPLVGPTVAMPISAGGDGPSDDEEHCAEKASGDGYQLPGAESLEHLRTSMSCRETATDCVKAGGWAVSWRSLALRPRLAAGLP